MHFSENLSISGDSGGQHRGRERSPRTDKGNPGDPPQLSRGDVTGDGIRSRAVFPTPISSI
jgi:hypothetical protein